jgi:hypothetical protein
MAKNETRRLRPAEIQADVDALSSLEQIAGYAPHKDYLKVENLKTIRDRMLALKAKERQSEAVFKADRDNTVADEWRHHNHMLEAKEQVIAQFGKSSNEVQALGLKKKTEYKKPTGRKPKK